MRFKSVLLAGLMAAALPLASVAEQGAYSATTGTFSASTTVGQNISVTGAALTGTKATLSLTCKITAYRGGVYSLTWDCSGGNITVTSTDHSISLSGSFSEGTMTLSVSGGRGAINYWYTFSGNFYSQVLVNGAAQGAVGSVSVGVRTPTPIGTSTAALTGLSLGWNSRYSPLLVATGGTPSLMMADAIRGANLVTYGTPGNGTGQFEKIAGLAHDATGRMYISDSSLDHLVRIDNMKGANWTQLGSMGTGNLHFSSPAGVAIDSKGKIWVADAGNNRIVRFDDMNGTNWTAFGAAGTGAKEFSGPSAIAFDAQGRIYVADQGNGRLVRFDDLTGKNWTTQSLISLPPYAYPLANINGVAVLPSGKIIMSTAGGWTYRVDDMTGANGQVGQWSGSIAGITSDPSGTVFVAGAFQPGLAQTLDATGTGYFPGSMGQSSLSPTAVLSLATSVVPPAVPLLSTGSFAFGNQNVGEPSATKPFVISNIGGGSLAITSISADSDYKIASSCPAAVAGAASCSATVTFEPIATGSRPAQLSVSTNGVHPQLDIALSGTGTAPHGVLFPNTLTFDPQKTATSSSPQTAILTNTGTGPLTLSSIAAAGDYSVTHNCPAVVKPGNGCTLQVTFKPTATGTRSGSVNIKDDNVPTGTTQSITLGGTGAASAPNLTLTPESFLFPAQQVGVASAAQTFTVSNTSASAVSLSKPVIPSGFAGTTTCTSSLGAGKSCTIQVSFIPAAAGQVNGAIS